MTSGTLGIFFTNVVWIWVVHYNQAMCRCVQLVKLMSGARESLSDVDDIYWLGMFIYCNIFFASAFRILDLVFTSKMQPNGLVDLHAWMHKCLWHVNKESLRTGDQLYFCGYDTRYFFQCIKDQQWVLEESTRHVSLDSTMNDVFYGCVCVHQHLYHQHLYHQDNFVKFVLEFSMWLSRNDFPPMVNTLYWHNDFRLRLPAQ